MKTRVKNLSEIISIDEQVKVLEATILKGFYHKLPELAQEGYCFNIYHFDLLRNCGQDEILEQIWDTDFVFKGINKSMLSYVVMCKGEKEAAHFIAQRVEKSKVWQNCYQQFSIEMYEEVGDWKALCKKGCYEILEKNKQFDLIINSALKFKGYVARAVKILRQNNMTERIMELKQYDWFMCNEWQPDGISILLKAEKFNTIYEHYRGQKGICPTAIKKMCNTEKGRNFLLEKGEYRWLIEAGYPKLVADARKWGILAQYRKYEDIDWDSWLATSPDSKEVFTEAAKAGKWDFLAKNQKLMLLFVNKEYRLFFTTLKECLPKISTSENSRELT